MDSLTSVMPLAKSWIHGVAQSSAPLDLDTIPHDQRSAEPRKSRPLGIRLH
jgi:hypothetical protein